VRCRDVKVSSFVAKVRNEVFAHFHAVVVNVSVVCGIGYLAYQGELFVNSSIDVRETDDDDALDFTLHPLRLSRSR
jgi:hypothetical protein